MYHCPIARLRPGSVVVFPVGMKLVEIILIVSPGPSIVTETIRKVTTARSLQNVRTALQIEMTVTPKSIGFMNLSAKKAIGQVVILDFQHNLLQ